MKEKLIKKRMSLIKKIEKYGNFIKGSVSRISKNGVSASGYYLTMKDKNQKTITKYISEKELRAVEKSINNMKKVRELIEEISLLNIKILKSD